ncbi:hypothetical protein ACWCQL_25055 [Streptomyces sp. NPDC002073]
MALAVRMSPEVERALGPQLAVQARSVTEGTCIDCQLPLDDQPVNVVLGMGPAGAGGLWFVHDRCAPSRVVELNAEAAALLVQPEGGHDMTMTAAVVDGTPVLVARLTTTLLTDSGIRGAEPRSIFMQVLLENGFHLVTGALDAPLLEQWIAVFQPYGRDLQLIVLSPTAEKFFHGTLARPPAGWSRPCSPRARCSFLAETSPAATTTSLTGCARPWPPPPAPGSWQAPASRVAAPATSA